MEMNQQEYDLVHQMITESGEMWCETQDRTKLSSEVVICTSPGRVFYLTRIGNVEGNINGWGVQIQPLSMEEARQFYAAFGSHYYYWIGATMQHPNPSFRVRAYIKNGRKPDWTISVEPCA